jgi:hypothetical protein
LSVVVGGGVEPSHWHGRSSAHPVVLKTARLDPGDAPMLNEPPQLRLSRLRREATRVGRQPECGGNQSVEATRVGRQPEWEATRVGRQSGGGGNQSVEATRVAVREANQRPFSEIVQGDRTSSTSSSSRWSAIRGNQGRSMEIAPPRRADGPPTLPLVVEGSGNGQRDTAQSRATQPRRHSGRARGRTPSPAYQASYRASREDPPARAHHGALARACPQRRVRRAATSSAAAPASDGLVRCRCLPPQQGR